MNTMIEIKGTLKIICAKCKKQHIVESGDGLICDCGNKCITVNSSPCWYTETIKDATVVQNRTIS